MSSRTRAIACILSAVHVCGCYSFREIQPPAVQPGSTIRVRITPEEALRQQQALGELTTTLQGQAVDAQTDGVIGITMRRTVGGPASPAFNTYLTVPIASVQGVEARRFNAGRTALLGVAGVAIGFAVVAISAGGTDDGETPEENSRIAVPLLRLFFR